MAGSSPQARIGHPQSPTLGGQLMLEWRPRLIFLILVIVLVAYAFGFATDNLQLDNWEW
jgi:hypothetical protein